MKTKIIMPLLALALTLAARGQSEQPAQEAAPQAVEVAAAVEAAAVKTPAPPPIPGILYQSVIKTDDVLAIGRNGEKVVIKWAQDFSACKGISILRNNVGLAKNRQVVAKLPASSKAYMDIAPDAHAYWYWIVVDIDDDKSKRIGPIRAKSDARKNGKYTDASKGIIFGVQRDQSSAVVAWDLPDGKYEDIIIRRRNKPDFLQGRNQRTLVRNTTERSGDLTDKLPDAEADYWYWIEATKEDGSVISKGPVKAEFGAK